MQTGTGVTTTTNYGYDLANRLISLDVSNNAVVPTSTSATFAYNAQGQRITRVENEVVTHFYYTGSALLFTTVNEYVLQTQNILDPSGALIASKRFEGQAEAGQDPYADDYFFYRYDVRGSVTNIVDGEGAVVKSYDYDEFGVTTSTGGGFHNEVTFTGSVADASGLLYMNARYYNPATARFLSQDTYTGSASVPWTQHLYAYCNNNPVNMVDPTGHRAGGLMRPLFININDNCGGSRKSSGVPKVTRNPQPTPTPNPNPAPQPGPSPEITEETHGGTKRSFISRVNDFIRNTDERVVLEAKYVAFYKGKLVIRHSIPNQTSCAIGGVIFLNRDELSTKPESIETVKHEYGHTVQESILGSYKYIKYIAIPSLTHRDPTNYYSNPWELTADLFGGVERSGGASYYVDGSIENALEYFVDAYYAKDFLPKPQQKTFPFQYLFPAQ